MKSTDFIDVAMKKSINTLSRWLTFWSRWICRVLRVLFRNRLRNILHFLHLFWIVYEENSAREFSDVSFPDISVLLFVAIVITWSEINVDKAVSFNNIIFFFFFFCSTSHRSFSLFSQITWVCKSINCHNANRDRTTTWILNTLFVNSCLSVLRWPFSFHRDSCPN